MVHAVYLDAPRDSTSSEPPFHPCTPVTISAIKLAFGIQPFRVHYILPYIPSTGHFSLDMLSAYHTQVQSALAIRFSAALEATDVSLGKITHPLPPPR